MVGAGRSVNTAIFYAYTAAPMRTQPYSYKVTVRTISSPPEWPQTRF